MWIFLLWVTSPPNIRFNVFHMNQRSVAYIDVLRVQNVHHDLAADLPSATVVVEERVDVTRALTHSLCLCVYLLLQVREISI